MQESITIPLSSKTIELLQKHIEAKDSIYNDLLENSDKLESLLISYHFKSRERVFNIEVKKGSISINPPGKGDFVVQYSIGMFNACADLDHTNNAAMKIHFEVSNFTTGEAILTGEYIPEREPDEI